MKEMKSLLCCIFLFSVNSYGQEDLKADDNSSEDWSVSSEPPEPVFKTDDPDKIALFKGIQKQFRCQFFNVRAEEKQVPVLPARPDPTVQVRKSGKKVPSVTFIEPPAIQPLRTSEPRTSTNSQEERNLYVLAKKGFVEQCLALLKDDEIDTPDDQGNTLLHYAAEQPDGVLCNELLRKGAHHYIKNSSEDTPLHRACATANIKTCACLLAHNASFEVCNRQGDTPLHAVAEYGDRRLMKVLVELGAFTSRKVDVDAVNYKTDDTPLHRACEKGNFDVASIFIILGAHQESKNRLGKTAYEQVPDEKKKIFSTLFHPNFKEWLKRALLFNSSSIVHALLSTDQALTEDLVTYTQSITALHIVCAVPSSEGELDQGLLVRKKKVHSEPLSDEDELNQSIILSELCEKLPNLAISKDAYGRTPLHIAAEWGRSAACTLLVENFDVPVDAPSSDTILTPLELAVAYNHTILVSYFLQQLVRQTSRENLLQRIPALVRRAIKQNALLSVDILLRVKNKCARNLEHPQYFIDSDKLLHAGCLKGDLALCQRVLKDGAIPNEAVDSFEEIDSIGGQITPLHCAAYAGHKNICLWLLKQHVHKVTLDRTTDVDYSPLTCACLANNDEVARCLVEQGALIRSVDLYHAPLPLMKYLYEQVISWYNMVPPEERSHFHEAYSGAGLLSSCDNAGRTLIHRFAQEGNVEKCTYFAHYFIDWSMQDNFGRTALHLACMPTDQNEQLRFTQAGHTVQVILENLDNKSVIDMQDYEGRTALHYAAAAKHGSAVVALLIDAGAQKNIAAHNGETAASLIKKSTSKRMQKLIQGRI